MFLYSSHTEDFVHAHNLYISVDVKERVLNIYSVHFFRCNSRGYCC
jgi:hypothetical protein